MNVIRNASLPVSRWHNGTGRKADIAAGDGWMAGFAWLDGDAPFSHLAGFDRTITLVEGLGFTLDIAGRERLEVHTPFAPAGFDGGAATQCRVAGACRVLNVMTARRRYRHGIAIAGLPFSATAAGSAILSMLVMLSGTATVTGVNGTVMLDVLDAVELDGPVRVEGAEGALLASITIERV